MNDICWTVVWAILVLMGIVLIWLGNNDKQERKEKALKKLSVMALAGRYAGARDDALLPYAERCMDAGATLDEVQAALQEAEKMP